MSITPSLQLDSRLLSIPPEIRLLIYAHLAADRFQRSAYATITAEDGTAISIKSPLAKYGRLVSLMRACQTLYRELEDFIYSRASFTIAPSMPNDGTFARIREILKSEIKSELPFLRVAQHVRIHVALGTSELLQTTVEKISNWIEILNDGGKVKSFQLDLYLWDEAEDQHPSQTDRPRAIVADASGLRQYGVLGHVNCARTRKLEDARRTLEFMKKSFGELQM